MEIKKLIKYLKSKIIWKKLQIGNDRIVSELKDKTTEIMQSEG